MVRKDSDVGPINQPNPTSLDIGVYRKKQYEQRKLLGLCGSCGKINDRKTVSCSSCTNSRSIWEAKNRSSRTKQKQKIVDGRRAIIDKIKSDNGCYLCGYNKSPRALQFHHTDPNNKVGAISMMLRNCVSMELILDEISKCSVICANCHSELHWDE